MPLYVAFATSPSQICIVEGDREHLHHPTFPSRWCTQTPTYALVTPPFLIETHANIAIMNTARHGDTAFLQPWMRSSVTCIPHPLTATTAKRWDTRPYQRYISIYMTPAP